MDSLSTSSRGEDDPEKLAIEQIKRARYISGKDVNDLVTTKYHVLSLYGPRTPVAVSESLVAQGAKNGASVNASAESEFAWYVYQRKLLLWRFKPNVEDKNASCSSAIELLLPKSDLPHHAHLVCVFKSRGSATASCLAVSPEGVIRLWGVLSPHSSWVDVNANLGGEEVCSVQHIPPYGFIAVTTSASLVFIKPVLARNSPTVVVEHISGTQGWLSGISRRMSTIIFGNDSLSVDSSENKVVKMVTVCGLRRGIVEWQVFLLVGMKLQLRFVCQEHPPPLVYEIDLEEMIQREFAHRAGTSSDTELVVLDVRASEGGLAILVASTEPRRYLLLELPCCDKTPPPNVFLLCDLCKRDIDILERNSGKIPHLQFLLLPTTVLIFNRRTIVGVPLDGGSQSRGDVLNVPGEGIIVGGVTHKSLPAFFSPTYGFVVVQPVEGACYEILKNATQRLSSPNKANKEIKMLPEQKHMTSIKTAFLMYIRQNTSQCQYVVDKEFANSTPDVVDSPLSLTLLRFSLDIIHNAPSSDPRWEHFNVGPKLASVVSLHIETQLREKLKAHDMFLDFACDSLITRVGKVTKNDKQVDVIRIIVEHNEKLLAALKLCQLQEKYGVLIDGAIFKALDELGLSTTHQNLTPKDIFYRYVSIVDVGLKCLIQECADVCASDDTLAKKKKFLVNTLNIVWNVTASVTSNKQNRQDGFTSDWLSAYSGPKAPYKYYKILFDMFTSLVDKISPEDEEEFHSKLVSLIRDLVDVILFLQSTTEPFERYETLRSWYIQYFIDHGHYMYAKQLSMKYHDIKALVELTYILEETKNIPEYIETYGSYGICKEIFSYLLKRGRKGELLSLKLPESYKEELTKSLTNHPDIFWMHRYDEKEPREAYSALVKYAAIYDKDVDKRERMWSLAKLISKSEEITDYDDQITRHLECIKAQRLLTGELETAKSVKAYNEEQIIHMLIDPQDVELTETHFKRALDLLRFIEDDVTKEKLKDDVWSKAVQIQKEDISSLKVDSPTEEFGNFLVFRLMHLIINMEDDPDTFIPPFENLNVSDDVDTSKRLIYFLRLGHEQITRNCRVAMDTQ